MAGGIALSFETRPSNPRQVYPLQARGDRLAYRRTVWLILLTLSVAIVLLPRTSERPRRIGMRGGFLFDPQALSEKDKSEEGHAWEMFEWWYAQRAYPNELIPKSGFYDAWDYVRTAMPRQAGGARGSVSWQSMGPDNVAGRMLSIAIDPENTERIWAGAASGGLWKSEVGGVGPNAWGRVETGFPALSVSAIVIDPANASNIWVGTGEISRFARPLVGTPGARSSYGLGVLASTDGGASWARTALTWTFDQSRAVLAMRMHPSDSQTLYAATSEGLYLTSDAGASWANVHDVLMAMDVVIDPTAPDVVYVCHGQLGVPAAPDAGIYKSTDGGASWTQLSGGLPTSDFGRTSLSISSDGAWIYAGVSDAATREVIGLFRSTDGGASWQLKSSDNWAGSQAWYDNVISVSPADRNLLLCGGLDCYRSTNGGSNLSRVTLWWLGFDGVVPNGGPEGPADYVHADQHAILWDPTNARNVYVACDGGIFRSSDAGQTWSGVNGGLQTSQFYAGFANGSSTPSLALGGLQDNGTLLYEGSSSWNKTFGGDGGWCAIDPSDEAVMYEEYVYGNIHKSVDGGDSWFEIHSLSNGSANFIAPFVICDTDPSTLYAGMLSVHKTTDGGSSWFYPDGNADWNGTPIAAIGVSRLDEDYVIAGTGSSSASATVEIRRSTNGGTNWTDVSAQLPDRYPSDFAYDPGDKNVVWMTFSGYGTGHVFRSTDAGLTWANVSGNLPDIPHQTVAVDPIQPEWAYVGTDLGVFYTTDTGSTWSEFNAGMPSAMITDLAIRRDDHRMRATTFGNGVYELDLPSPATVAEPQGPGDVSGFELAGASPNPFRRKASIRFTLGRACEVTLNVYDGTGRHVRTLASGRHRRGVSEVGWDGTDASGARVAAGVYFVRLSAEGRSETSKVMVMP